MTSQSGYHQDSPQHAQPQLWQLLPYTGLWTMHVWIYWFNSAQASSGARLAAWLNIYGVMSLALLLCACLGFRKKLTSLPRARTPRLHPADAIMTALMVACSVLVLISPGPGDAAAVGAGGAGAASSGAGVAAVLPGLAVVLGGVCMSWAYIRWFGCYVQLDIRSAIAGLFMSYTVGSAVKLLFDSLPALPMGILAALLPLLSTALLLVCPQRGHAQAGVPGQQPSETSQSFYTWDSAAPLVRIGICVFVFSLLRMVLPFSHNLHSSLLGHAVELFFSAGVLFWVLKLKKPLDFPQLWRFVFIFLSTGVVLLCVGAPALLSGLCSTVATSMMVMLLWLLLVDVARHSKAQPAALFSGGWLVYVGGWYVGHLVLQFAPGLPGMRATGIWALWILAMVMVLYLDVRNPDTQRIFSDLHATVPPGEYATLAGRCAELGAANGLTRREADVLTLLAKGRSKGFIAEELCISENTVRGHARHIYAKLGVHSKDELQTRLGL